MPSLYRGVARKGKDSKYIALRNSVLIPTYERAARRPPLPSVSKSNLFFRSPA